MSEDGTQQSDPEAAPLFAKTIQTLVKQMELFSFSFKYFIFCMDFFLLGVAVKVSYVSSTDDVLIAHSKNFQMSEGSLIFRPLIFSRKEAMPLS